MQAQPELRIVESSLRTRKPCQAETWMQILADLGCSRAMWAFGMGLIDHQRIDSPSFVKDGAKTLALYGLGSFFWTLPSSIC